ncbi:hypothetical protein KAU18_01375 [Candidatus Bathyarchaeota archaeon]|nr:hypothetical protein [Candidatus Bathyarchaeota archaeon]
MSPMDLIAIVAANLQLTLKIIVMVTALMSVIEYLEQRYSDKIKSMITDKPLKQIIAASLLGAVPGCMDAFLVVSLYIHGTVGFGALTAVMLSTAGDEAFIMLALIPGDTPKILAATAVLGVVGGLIAHKTVDAFHLKLDRPCDLHKREGVEERNFFKDHVVKHIILEHAPRLFIWILVPLTIIDTLILGFDFASYVSSMPVLVLMVSAALVGVIPESGPHLVFLMLYSRGLIPLSVLIVSTLSQDGHGLLPLISHSVKDTAYVQLFTTGFSLVVGVLLYFLGF